MENIWTINPNTGYSIKVGGKTFTKLISSGGYIYNERTNEISFFGEYGIIPEKSVKKSEIKAQIFCTPVKKDKKEKWRTERPIGKGAFSSVWSACTDSKCNHVLKYQKYGCLEQNPKIVVNKKFIQNEIRLINKCADAGLCPRVVDAWYCDDGGSYILPLLNLTVFDLLHKYKTRNIRWKIFGEILVLVSRIHDEDIVHNDLHFKNIMVTEKILTKKEDDHIEKQKLPINVENLRYKYSDYKYYLIDFGLAKNITKSNKYSEISKEYKRMAFWTKQYQNNFDNVAHFIDFATILNQMSKSFGSR